MATASSTQIQIQAPTPTGELANVEKLEHTSAKETMGVWQSSDGSQTTQLQKTQGQLNN